MASVKWIKITTDMFDNRKIKHLRRLPDGNNIVLIWIMLLTMAGRCNSGGMIFLTENIPYTTKMLADELQFEENTVKLALEALERFGMIVVREEFFAIAGWEEHQNIDGLERIREKNRIRKQRQRERAAMLPAPDEMSQGESRDCHVTGHAANCDSHAIDIDKDIDKEKEREGDIHIESAPDDVDDLTKRLTEMYVDKQKEETDTIPYAAIVAYLNEKAGTKYKATSDKTKTAIRARFADGFTEEDFRAVIDKKCLEWMGTEWEKYLRPSTLFGTKFEEYLNGKTGRKADKNAGYCFDANEDSLDDLF